MDENSESKAVNTNDYDYANYAEEGLSDVPLPIIPELKIIQPTTKRLTNKDSLLFGKTPGLIYNTITEGCGKTVEIVPVNIRNIWNVSTVISTTKREFIGAYSTKPPGTKYIQGKGAITESGDLVEKGIILTGVQVKSDDSFELAHIRFFSRQNAVGRAIIELLTLQVQPINGKAPYTPPIYARTLSLSSQFEKDKNYEWFDWTLSDKIIWNNPKGRLFIHSKSFLHIAQRFYNEITGDFNSVTGELDGDKETLP